MPTTRRDLLETTGAGPGFAMTMMEMRLGVRAATTAGAKLHWVPAEFLRDQKVRAWSDMPVWVPTAPEMAGFKAQTPERQANQA